MAESPFGKGKKFGDFDSDGGDAGLTTLMAYILGQNKGQDLKQELGPGAIPTKGTSPSGATYENPEALAQVKGAEQQAQRVVETAPSRSIMRGTLQKAKMLADTVPAPKAGIGRIIKGAQNQFRGEVTQSLPQVKEYNSMIDSALTAFARTMFAEKGNVANWDIARVKKAFSDIAWDTEDTRALSWNRAIDTYNDVIGSYKSLSSELIDKRELMSPKEIGRSRLISGLNEYSDLTDDELEGAFEGDIEVVPKPYLEKLIKTYESRNLHQRKK